MKKVMIVDDDRDFLNEISESLKKQGYKVFSFSDGELALKQIQEIEPDVILLDIKMERVSGLMMANEIKRRPFSKNIPLIAMSGVYTDESHQFVMKTFGIKQCLTKPLNVQDVVDLIERVE
jgi:DNA-binding response OmpR family regulator